VKLVDRLRGLGFEERPSRWGADPAFWWQGREIVHTHGEVVEIRLTRKGIRDLDDERAMLRARNSDWVMVAMEHDELIHALAARARELNGAD
jgi:hypothetical protein